MTAPKQLLAAPALLLILLSLVINFSSAAWAVEHSTKHLARIKAVLEPTTPTTNDVFGVSTLLTAEQAIIGAPWDSTNINNGGLVYVYSRGATEGNVAQTATWQHKSVIAPPTLHAKAMFGSSLAISGNLLFIGAPGEKATKADKSLISAGAVYVYTRSVSSKPWEYAAKLTAPDQHPGDYFGASIAIAGPNVFVGAHLQDNSGVDSGAVYHFRRQNTATDFQYQQKLQPANLKAGALFGNALSADNNTLAIGAYGFDGHSPGGGSVYIYEEKGNTWQETAQLQAVKRKAFAEFGWSLALKGNRLVVGAPYEDRKNASPGAVYVFERGAKTWQPVARLRYVDQAWEQRFGASVALTEDAVVVGAPYGVAYVFQVEENMKTPLTDELKSLPLASWPQLGKLVGTTPYSANLFNGTIALYNGDVLLGVPSQIKTGSGAAYVFPNAIPTSHDTPQGTIPGNPVE